ncbi:putative signaling protein [Steroidobacter agaridevorans]|uniref:cyclic-guanylate-specific phosphodiesterase n=1 Tax=Steroidobacter agaridevorans TaxID=2695856 RepID=A0A829YM79_9GAMM|nr:bifunctional diguanylate cyclase/phosphodiesterase [Steroidobacter agaridevorans]GFE84477.1 putative signaling protein [Steroidobacter agaridevorans]
MNGSYNLWLVALSFAIAVCVSYTALNLASRVATARRQYVRMWLAGGALAMGVGIWSMHFIGMLAFTLPIPLSYDIPKTLASLVVAILVSGFALSIASQKRSSLGRLAGAAVLMGLGIAGMHYSGMGAIRIVPFITYEPKLLILSVVIAIVASFAALWLFFRLRGGASWRIFLQRSAAALVMGAAICGMHYTGMFASQFAPGSYCIGATSTSNGWLALLIGGFALSVLLITMILLMYDAHLESRSRQHAVALEDANARLRHLATHDSLTELPNRLLLDDRLTQAISYAERREGRVAVLVIDLDRFKMINDSLGHHGGDELLKEVANRLRGTLRKSDTLARTGGDEFVLIADEVTGQSDVEQLAQRLLACFAKPFHILSVDIHTAPSIGISVYPSDGARAEELVVAADAAMYHSKKVGGNTYSFFTPSMNAFAQQRLELENGLRRALGNGEFELHYQPKVDVTSGRISSTEALIRWRHPERGLVPPGDFIPLAEETGLILQIGEWVLREACRQARQWQVNGMAPVRVAINMSATQFRQKNLVSIVKSALENANLEPTYLEIELTESAVMHNAAASAEILEQLSRLGVHISIDDFGTGYSSLNYLRRFPLDKLKIDRTFIKDVVANPEDAAIVQAIISLAHSLRLKVIAEGVETEQQLQFLRSLGCDQYQGFFCSPAMEPEAFAEMMRAKNPGKFDPLATMSRLYVPVKARKTGTAS